MSEFDVFFEPSLEQRVTVAGRPFIHNVKPAHALDAWGELLFFSIARCRYHGGARRDRTDDLMLAKHALYQLSYGPLERLAWLNCLGDSRSHRRTLHVPRWGRRSAMMRKEKRRRRRPAPV